MTSLIDTLERRALVAQRRDAQDRRRQLVTITAAVHQFVPEAVALQTAVMRGLSEPERVRLTRMLLTISKTLPTLDGDEPRWGEAGPRPTARSIDDDTRRCHRVKRELSSNEPNPARQQSIAIHRHT